MLTILTENNEIISITMADLEKYCAGQGVDGATMQRWISWGWLPGRNTIGIWSAYRQDLAAFFAALELPAKRRPAQLQKLCRTYRDINRYRRAGNHE